MPEREKVIKGLECCTFILGKRKCNECPYQKGLPDNGCYQLQDDFHALLKEQEAHKFFVDESGKITPLPVVVRCKDCKRRETYQCPVHVGCGGDGYDEPDEWFCADGERR